MDLHVQDVGEGPPVVLLAGFGLSHEVWDREVRVLCEAGRRVLCVDLRGTGGSPKPPGGYGIEQHSADVLAVLERLDLRDVTLVGWSFGGQVAFQLAAAAPERIVRLGLVCSAGVRASRSEAFPFGAPADKLLPALVAGERDDRLAARRRTLASAFAAPAPEALEFLLRVQLQMPSWAAIASYEAYLTTDLVGLLGEIACPVLLVTGAADPVTSTAAARWTAERLDEARVVELDGCGHYPMFEAGAAFDDALVAFAAAGA